MRALVFIFVFLWVTAMSSWLSAPASFCFKFVPSVLSQPNSWRGQQLWYSGK